MQLRHVKSTRPSRLSVAALFEFLTLAQLVQTTQMPFVGTVTHISFTATYVHPSQSTQLANPMSKWRSDAYISEIRRSIHFLKLQFPIHQCFLQPESPQTNVFRRNSVTTASRVINDCLTVCRNCHTALVTKIRQLALVWIPNDLVPDVMAANSSLSQLDSATLFCFFAQQLRTPPPRVTTPPLVDLREVLSEASQHPCSTRVLQVESHEKGNPAKQLVLSSSIVQLASPLSCLRC